MAAAAQGFEIQQHHHIQQVIPPEDIKAAANVPAQITDAVFQGDRLKRFPERVFQQRPDPFVIGPAQQFFFRRPQQELL